MSESAAVERVEKTFEWKGRTYTVVRPDTKYLMEEAKKRILTLRGGAVRSLIEDQAQFEKAGPELRKLLVAEAVRADSNRLVTAAEMRDWIETFEGRVFSLWLSLRVRHPDITEDDVRQMVTETVWDAMEGQADVAAAKPAGESTA